VKPPKNSVPEDCDSYLVPMEHTSGTIWDDFWRVTISDEFRKFWVLLHGFFCFPSNVSGPLCDSWFRRGEGLDVGTLLIMAFTRKAHSMTILFRIQHNTAAVICDPLQLDEFSTW